MTEDTVVAKVQDVIFELQKKQDSCKSDNNITIEDKAVYLSELNTALLLLRSVKRSGRRASVRVKTNTCYNNNQLINCAKECIKYNEELEAEYTNLKGICYYPVSQ